MSTTRPPESPAPPEPDPVFAIEREEPRPPSLDQPPDGPLRPVYDEVVEQLRAGYELRQDAKAVRTERDKQTTALRDFLINLIEVKEAGLDKLIATFRQRQAAGEDVGDGAEVWLKRLERLQRNLENTLASFDVTSYRPSGQPVAGRDNIIQTVPDATVAQGEIVEVVHNAYLWQGKVLRPAAVWVAE